LKQEYASLLAIVGVDLARTHVWQQRQQEIFENNFLDDF
jgi:hypothetical protein